ncbi:aldo/keto reductase [Spirulina sp. CCNP1310]|uniref:aldo/keto reductase n=1 Tax=Spirulina sp. CCNP1310 TaxID=3110249 RepID=UPI002B1FCF42|nr:aldo/keto reductase [Spirulina sp. CCNP1310]MEA5418186.1 aldo/keto reductase [Spirulina sp. CCNP1310]
MPSLPPSSPALTWPELGCGTWAWGNRLLWDYRPEMDDDLQAAFNYAVGRGMTFFDTGDSYGTGKLKGQSEILLGRFAREYSGPNRENICIGTKLAPYPWRLTPQAMVKAAAASAERLGRPIDLVQLHWSTANYFPWQEGPLLDGLAQLYQQGLVKGVGLSNFGPQRLRWAHERLGDRHVPIASLQVQYSLLSTYPVTELGLKEKCDRLGIQLIAYSPLALGLLTGKYTPEGPYPKGLRGVVCRQILPGMEPLRQCLAQLAQEKNKTIAQIALNWCICKGTMPIPGAKTIAQAQENAGAMGWRLHEGEVAALDQAAALAKPIVQNIFQSH